MLDAVIELSQTHTGALLILETNAPIDERDFFSPGVKLDALVSKELLQTIFQPTTRLHNGAILIRASRIVVARALLPLTHRIAPRQLGARHRAAIEFTERFDNCLCVVVSGETGFIAVAEKGILNRPITSLVD